MMAALCAEEPDTVDGFCLTASPLTPTLMGTKPINSLYSAERGWLIVDFIQWPLIVIIFAAQRGWLLSLDRQRRVGA